MGLGERKEDKMVICNVGQGREREENGDKDFDHAFQHCFYFKKCLLHACVNSHKCNRFYIFFFKLKKHKKRRQLDISLTRFFYKCKKWEIAMLNEEDGVGILLYL